MRFRRLRLVIKRGLQGLTVLAVLALVVGITFQSLASRRYLQGNSPPGILTNVGEHMLHLFCVGEGRPTVVFDTGLGLSLQTWRRVQPQIGELTRACSYDRAGYGWSDAGPEPRTSARIVSELSMLLENADVSSPYILVGHSFGGLNVRLFARSFPERVAGLVLVDGSHEGQLEVLPELPAATRFLTRLAPVLTRIGVPRLMVLLQRNQIPSEEAVRHRIQQSMLSRSVNAVVSESRNLEFSMTGVRSTNNQHGATPLRVLVAGNPPPTPFLVVPV